MVTTMSEEIQQLFRNLRQRKKAEMVEGELAAPRETLTFLYRSPGPTAAGGVTR